MEKCDGFRVWCPWTYPGFAGDFLVFLRKTLNSFIAYFANSVMVVRSEQPWKASIRTRSKESLTTIGRHSKSTIHALIIRTTMRRSIKCLAAAILTRWVLFNTDAAPAEKYAELRSPASPAFVFPVPRCILPRFFLIHQRRLISPCVWPRPRNWELSGQASVFLAIEV